MAKDEIRSFIKIGKRLNEAFPSKEDKHFRFNLWVDFFIVLLVLIYTLSQNDIIPKAIAAWRGNVIENSSPNFFNIVILPAIMFFLCFGLCVWINLFIIKGKKKNN